jgi:hypothetical protein
VEETKNIKRGDIIKVILISGKAQSGKDTAASFIRDLLVHKGKRVLITHYADLLKYICIKYLNWNGEKDESGRQLLQNVGTDIIRKKDPDFWVNFVAQVLGYLHNNWDYVIIPDCRFENEIDVIKKYGFSTIHLRVSRNDIPNNILTDGQKSHISETALDNVAPDYILSNNGTYEHFKNKIYQWVKEAVIND